MKCLRCENELATGDTWSMCRKCREELEKEIGAPLPALNPGWICPVCGRGVAPWMQTCPCQPATPNRYIITCDASAGGE